MKDVKLVWLTAFFCLFLAAGCENNEYTEEDSPFKVIRSEIPHTPYQATGSIEVSLADYAVAVTENWCKAVKNGTTVDLEIDPNINTGSRTAQVILTWGKTVVKVPVTQPAMILDVGNGTKDIYFAQSGGTRTLSVFSNVDFEVSALGDADWATIAKKQHNAVSISAGELPAGENSRMAVVRVSCSGKNHDINVYQFRHPDYEQLLGKAILSFRGVNRYEEDGALKTDTVPKKTVVEITALNEAAFSYNVKATFNGIDVNFVMSYQPAQDGMLKVYGNQLLRPYSDGDRLNVTHIFLRTCAIGKNATGIPTYYYSTNGANAPADERFVYPAKSQIAADGILYTFYDGRDWPDNAYFGPRWLQGFCISGQTSANPPSSANPTVNYEVVFGATLLFPFDPGMISDLE